MNGVIFKWLINKIRSSIPSVILMTLCSVFASVSGVLFALGTKNIIDVAVSGNKARFPRACLIQIAIILCILIFNALLQHSKEKMHARLDREWKRSLMHDLLISEYRCVSKFHSSELVNRLNNDVRILDDAIVSLLPNLFSMITRVVAAFVILAALTPLFSLILLVCGIVVVLLTGFLRRYLKDLHKRVSEADGRVSGILQETLEKLLAVQAMGVAPEIERRTKKCLDDRFLIHCKRKNLSLLVNACISILYYGAGFAALVFCSVGLLREAITFGTMTAVIQLVNQLQGPIVGLSGILPQYAAASAALERMHELDAMPKNTEVNNDFPCDLYDRMSFIAASDLTFSYEHDLIFDNAKFSLPKGSFSVVIGQSGIGKSTLLKILLGIYPIEGGSLYLQCGNEKLPIDSSTRSLFAYVPQGNLVFSGTIRENLLVVKPTATQAEINHAVYISAMDQYVENLSDGLDTIIGESGAGLSEGQIQRLAIARAILMGAPILLLDECTSALDAETEMTVLCRINALKDKTCIAVTHRNVPRELFNTTLKIVDKKINILTQYSMEDSHG